VKADEDVEEDQEKVELQVVDNTKEDKNYNGEKWKQKVNNEKE
jgi:hypothetical protein